MLGSSPNATPTPIPSLWLLPGANPLPLQTPIQESLIEFMDGGISRLATEAFQGRRGGTSTPTPCPMSIPTPILGEWWGKDQGGQLGWPGAGGLAPLVPLPRVPGMLPTPRGVCPRRRDGVSCVTTWLCHPQL